MYLQSGKDYFESHMLYYRLEMRILIKFVSKCMKITMRLESGFLPSSVKIQPISGHSDWPKRDLETLKGPVSSKQSDRKLVRHIRHTIVWRIEPTPEAAIQYYVWVIQ